MHRKALVAAGWLLLAALLSAAPIWEGGAPADAWHALVAGALLLGAVAAVRLLFVGEKLRYPRVSFALLSLFVAFVALQAIPWPQSAVGKLSPERMRLEHEAIETMGVESDGGPRAISIEPERTEGHALKWLAYLIVMFAAMAWVRRRRDARMMLLLIAVLAGAQAVWGLVRDGGSFVNRNHHAGLLAMGFFASLSLLLDRAARVRAPPFPSWRARLAALLDRRFFWQATVLAGLSVVVGLVILFSRSRGAVLAAAGGLLVLLAVSRRSVALAGAVAALAIGALVFGIGPLIGRLERIEVGGPEQPGYATFFRMSWQVFETYPASGAGMGTFRTSTAPMWPVESATWYAFFAHNDYLDALSGTGAVGGGLFAASIAAILILALIRARASPLAAGAAAALIAHAAHANAGFNFQMPANALWFFALAGMVLSPAFGRVRGRSGTPAAILLLVAAALGGLGLARSWTAHRRTLPVEELSRRLEAGEIDRPSEAAAGEARRAGRWLAVARIERSLGRPWEEALARAVAVEPASAAPLVEAGWAAAARGDLTRADRAFRLARRRDRANPWVLKKALAYWLRRGDLDEIAACAAPLLWTGLREPRQLFEEIALATGSLDILQQLLPEPGHPWRPIWEAELKRFLSARVR